MDRIYQQILAHCANPSDLVRCKIIVPSGSWAQKIQQSFLTQGTGPIPEIIACTQMMPELAKPDTIHMIIDILDRLSAAPVDFARKLTLTQSVIQTCSLIERFGAMISPPPFPLRTSTFAQTLWNITQEMWQRYYPMRANIWQALARLQAQLQHDTTSIVFWLSPWETLSLPALDAWHAFLENRPNSYRLSVPKSHCDFAYHIFESKHDEIREVAEQIASCHLHHLESAITIFADSETQKRLRAELITKQVPVNDPAERSWFACAEGGLLLDLAVWQSEPTYLHLLRLLQNPCVQESLPGEWKDFRLYLTQKIVLADAYIQNGEVVYPAEMDVFVESMGPKQRAKLEPILPFITKIQQTLRPFDAENLSLEAFRQQHQQAWELFWGEMVQAAPPPFPFADLPCLPMTPQQYGQLVPFLLQYQHTEQTHLESWAAGEGAPVVLRSPDRAPLETWDYAFYVGLSDPNGFSVPDLGLLFQTQQTFVQQYEEDIWRSLQREGGHLYVSVSKESPPHRCLIAQTAIEHVSKRAKLPGGESVKSSEGIAPPESRPARLSITDMQLLHDDPYAFYGKRVLKLFPIPAPSMMRVYGQWVHYILEHYCKMPLGSGGTLVEFAQQCSRQPFVRHRFLPKALPVLAQIDASLHDGQDRRIYTEYPLSGKVDSAGRYFEIHGVADRIDVIATPEGNAAAIIDYKTGMLPSARAWERLEALQLPIEAFLLSRQKDLEYTSMSIHLLQLKTDKGPLQHLDADASAQFIARVEAAIGEILSLYNAPDFTFLTTDDMANRSCAYLHLSRML